MGKTNPIAESTDYTTLIKKGAINVLAVEDNRIAMGFLEAQIKALHHAMIPARDGNEALAILAQCKDSIDVVLMDREMPVMDGLTAVRRMKENPELRNIPVIMVTGADTVQEMQEGLDAGVFYYLTKPVQVEMLRTVMGAAVREARQWRTLARELGKNRTSFTLIENCKLNFRTLSEAESLAAFIANCFPDRGRVLMGIGELLINAVEHGILGIEYDEKTHLISSNTWLTEIEQRQQLPEYIEKAATATIVRNSEGTYVTIDDFGKGFDWKNYLQMDPARTSDNHGRGIAQARIISFDTLTYNDIGNQVTAFVSNTPSPEAE
jgi:two-component system, cell cycle response regulator